MKWSELSARQRDVMVTEKVFGLPVKQAKDIVLPNGAQFLGDPDYLVMHDEKDFPLAAVPDYSTNMDKAWAVLRFVESDLRDKEHPGRNVYTQAEYFLSRIATSYDNYSDHYSSDEAIFSLGDLAELTPEKICKAALEACGERFKD